MQLNWRNRTVSLNKTIFIVLSISFIFTTLSVLAKHYNFKTSAYDTGIQVGVARNIVFEGSFYNEVMDVNHLSDHFALALAIPGLFLYIWDSPAVFLIFQNLCIFLSIIIAYFLALKILKNEFQALLLSFFYAFNYYLTQVNTNEYHIDTLAIPLLLTLLLVVENHQSIKNLIVITAISFIVISIKEDFPITLACLGAFVFLFKKGKRVSGAIMFFIGVVSFYIILNHLMPRDMSNEYAHINYYSGLGETTSEVVMNILTRPDIVIKNLVTPPEKILRLCILLFSFMMLPIFAPVALLSGAAPIFYQMVSSYYHQYNFHSHYSSPALPFLFYSSVFGFIRVKDFLRKLEIRGWYKFKVGIIALGMTLLLFTTISTIVVYSRSLVRYDHERYLTFKNEIKPQIPSSSKVISTNRLQPHFIGYEKSGRLWRYSDLEAEHDYIVVYLREPSLPWPDSLYNHFLEDVKAQYTIIYEDKDFLALKKLDEIE